MRHPKAVLKTPRSGPDLCVLSGPTHSPKQIKSIGDACSRDEADAMMAIEVERLEGEAYQATTVCIHSRRLGRILTMTEVT